MHLQTEITFPPPTSIARQEQHANPYSIFQRYQDRPTSCMWTTAWGGETFSLGFLDGSSLSYCNHTCVLLEIRD